MMGGTTRFTGVVSLAAVLVLACGGAAGGGTASTTTGEDLVIGAPMFLTGRQSKEGAPARHGDDLGLQWINQPGGINDKDVKHKGQLKYEDDTSKADISAQLAQKLITEEKAQFLLGPYGSATTASDAVVAEKNSI